MPEGYREVMADKERLEALYKHHSLAEIGEMFGVSGASVAYYMRKHGIPRRPNGVLPDRHPGDTRTGAEIRRERRRPARPTFLAWEPPDTRARIQISWFRLHVLSGRCPEMCPEAGFCDGVTGEPEDRRSGCPLYNKLKSINELRPRPWEPDNPFEYWGERIGPAQDPLTLD